MIKTYKIGKLKVDANDVGEVESATLNITLEPGSTTAIGDTWNEVMPLGKSWELTATLKYDPDDAAQAALQQEFIAGDGALDAVYMYEDAAKYYSGAAIITSFNIAKSVGAIDTVSVTFVGNGALSYT